MRIWLLLQQPKANLVVIFWEEAFNETDNRVYFKLERDFPRTIQDLSVPEFSFSENATYNNN